MAFEIIDFHAHPFPDAAHNICAHKDVVPMPEQTIVELYRHLGISKVCGSVIQPGNNEDRWAKIKANNDHALQLRELYGDFYVPGFHIHPDYVEESIAEIDRMSRLGVRLIGELVPYLDDWSESYNSENLSLLLDEAGKHNMIVSFHTQDDDAVDKMVKCHPDVIFVAAHPNERPALLRHIERMKYSDNYYLDISGLGIHRYGMLKRAVDAMGADRILFGTDYPTCNPAIYIGGVLNDERLTDGEKEKIFSLNAKRLLGI